MRSIGTHTLTETGLHPLFSHLWYQLSLPLRGGGGGGENRVGGEAYGLLTSSLHFSGVLMVCIAGNSPPVSHSCVVPGTVRTHVHYAAMGEDLVIDAWREGIL